MMVDGQFSDAEDELYDADMEKVGNNSSIADPVSNSHDACGANPDCNISYSHVNEEDEWYDEEESEDEYWDDKPIQNKENDSASNKQKKSLQPQDKQFSKFTNRIKLDKYQGQGGGKVATHLSESTK